MMMRRAACALLLVMALAASGCGFLVGAGIGAAGAYAGYRYTSGKLQTTYNESYEQVYDATLASLKDMNIAVTKVQKDAAGAKIEAQRADGTDVAVDLSKSGPISTDASIRVGTLGDEAASKVIAGNIARRLERGRGAGPAQPDIKSEDIGAD